MAVSELHRNPPMTLGRVRARHTWILPTAIVVFTLLAIGAAFDWLFWDKPIANWVYDHRTSDIIWFARHVSFLGSTPIVFSLSLVLAVIAWPRCPRLAMAILVIALARPVTEHFLKLLVDRPRPDGHRLVNGKGPSFPSGHPLATAASWCLIPLVAALYVKRRAVWWAIAISVWTLAVGVAATRVVLGVHWPTDVVASLVLVIVGVAAVELFVEHAHTYRRPSLEMPHAEVPNDPAFKPCSLRAPRV